MQKKASSVVKYVLSLFLAAALLFFAFRGLDWAEFWTGLKTTAWGYILLSMLAAVAALIFRALRWRQQLVILDPAITFRSVWHGSNIGNFLSIIIPGVGEFVRCADVSTKKAGYDRTFGTIILERSWDVISILVLIVIALVGNREVLGDFFNDNIVEPFAARFSVSLWWILAAVLVFLALSVWAVFRFEDRSGFCARCAGAARGVARGIAAFGRMKHKWLFLAYTAGIWVMYILMTYFTFLAVPGLDHLSFADATFISAIGNIASVIPTPGNLGAYHYLVGLAISNIYQASAAITATALLCATLSHGSHAILLIVLGLWSYVRRAFFRKSGGETAQK